MAFPPPPQRPSEHPTSGGSGKGQRRGRTRRRTPLGQARKDHQGRISTLPLKSPFVHRHLGEPPSHWPLTAVLPRELSVSEHQPRCGRPTTARRWHSPRRRPGGGPAGAAVKCRGNALPVGPCRRGSWRSSGLWQAWLSGLSFTVISTASHSTLTPPLGWRQCFHQSRAPVVHRTSPCAHPAATWVLLTRCWCGCSLGQGWHCAVLRCTSHTLVTLTSTVKMHTVLKCQN
ncbi:hypothetical protein E2C01_040994 [Portunus trituberculatus]|uniref:Uncharacterized protein n=1 Tax=Portunus trituberculatus TaxID=210409 RepID=A0A5B7FSA2_PORTR|nr:hypothetical protein [Portunus trituberculatus]